MEYPGPSEDDFANVRALNAAFLTGVKEERFELRDQDDSLLQELVAALSPAQVERLAATPFLLFTLHENRPDYWDGLFAKESAADLFTPRGSSSARELVAGAIGFLWRLAGQNPYTARVVSGAPLGWCERLAAEPLIDVLQSAVSRHDLVAPRFPAASNMWQKLLGAGVSSDEQVRRAAQLAALQSMLTGAPQEPAMRAAACRFAPPPSR